MLWKKGILYNKKYVKSNIEFENIEIGISSKNWKTRRYLVIYNLPLYITWVTLILASYFSSDHSLKVHYKEIVVIIVISSFILEFKYLNAKRRYYINKIIPTFLFPEKILHYNFIIYTNTLYTAFLAILVILTKLKISNHLSYWFWSRLQV